MMPPPIMRARIAQTAPTKEQAHRSPEDNLRGHREAASADPLTLLSLFDDSFAARPYSCVSTGLEASRKGKFPNRVAYFRPSLNRFCRDRWGRASKGTLARANSRVRPAWHEPCALLGRFEFTPVQGVHQLSLTRAGAGKILPLRSGLIRGNRT